VATRLEILERNLTRAFTRYHADAQIRRVLGVFAGTLAMQLLTGFHDWTWKGLLAVAAAAGYATLRKVYPTVPWSLVLSHLHQQQAVQARQAAAVQATVPAVSGAPADRLYTPVTQGTAQVPAPITGSSPPPSAPASG
jgi:hypothetical protein